jgi:outer membrane assembly lipoprotein YfiO
LVGCAAPIPREEDAHFEAARRLQEDRAEKGALRLYREYMERYPGRARAEVALQKSFEIALRHFQTGWGGRALSELLESHPAAPLAGEAAFRVGEYHFSRGEFEDAIAAFKRVMRDYRESERLEGAVFFIGESHLGQYEGVNYDRTPLEDAKAQYEMLLASFPTGVYAQRGRERLREIDGELAGRDYAAALFYAGRGRQKSARVYLEAILRDYPQTGYAALAQEMLSRQQAEGGR